MISPFCNISNTFPESGEKLSSWMLGLSSSILWKVCALLLLTLSSSCCLWKLLQHTEKRHSCEKSGFCTYITVRDIICNCCCKWCCLKTKPKQKNEKNIFYYFWSVGSFGSITGKYFPCYVAHCSLQQKLFQHDACYVMYKEALKSTQSFLLLFVFWGDFSLPEAGNLVLKVLVVRLCSVFLVPSLFHKSFGLRWGAAVPRQQKSKAAWRELRSGWKMPRPRGRWGFRAQDSCQGWVCTSGCCIRRRVMPNYGFLMAHLGRGM